MPKLKTHKAAAKRFKITGGGKILRMKGYRSHLHRHRSKRTINLYSKMQNISPADRNRLERLLPYGTT